MRRTLLFTCLLISFFNAFANNNTQTTTEDQSLGTNLSVLLKKVKLTGYGQVGYTYNSSSTADGKESNTFDIRRIMFLAEAEVINNLTLRWLYDFEGTKTHEIWGEYKFCDALKLKIGQYKVPFSLENNMSPASLELIAGAQSVNYLSGIPPVDSCYGGNGGRDLGIMIHGDIIPYRGHKFISYKLGVFNGQGINVRDKNNQKDVSGSLMFNPLKELSIGGSFLLGKGHALANNPFGYIKKGENYRRDRWGVATEIQTAPVYLRAEYMRGKDGEIESEGYYAVARVPLHPKVDLIASYDYFAPTTKIEREYNVVPEQANYILGVQWNFYRRCRIQAQYIYQDKADGWKNGNMIMTQFQLGF